MMKDLNRLLQMMKELNIKLLMKVINFLDRIIKEKK